MMQGNFMACYSSDRLLYCYRKEMRPPQGPNLFFRAIWSAKFRSDCKNAAKQIAKDKFYRAKFISSSLLCALLP
jgi:hypothetical protein